MLWPTVLVRTLPGLHRTGSGEVLVRALVAVYSAGAALLLLAGPRARQVLPVCLPVFAVAAVLGALVRAAAVTSSPDGWRTSASVGAVRGVPPEQPEDRQAWSLRRVDDADELMYRAKRSGGDRVLSRAT